MQNINNKEQFELNNKFILRFVHYSVHRTSELHRANEMHSEKTRNTVSRCKTLEE